MRIPWVALVALGLLAGALPGQSGAGPIRAGVDLTRVTVGDVVTVTVTVEHDSAATVSWGDTPEQLGSFDVLAVREMEPVAAAGRVTSGIQYTIAAYQLGELEIPALETAVQQGEAVDTLTTEPLRVTVESVGQDTGGDIRGIKPPLDIARDWWLLLPWVLGAAAVAAVAAWAYRRYRRDAGRLAPSVPPVGPPRPPHELAHEALDRLASSSYLDRGELKTYFSEASEIVRVYLDRRYGIDALDMTTQDILAELSGETLEADVLGCFADFFAQCDLVKFAKRRPGLTDCRALIPLARALVDRTKPAVAAAGAQGESEAAEDRPAVAAAPASEHATAE